MAKKMVSIRLEPDLIEHVKSQAIKKYKDFTEYLEEALIEKSNYKPKKKAA